MAHYEVRYGDGPLIRLRFYRVTEFGGEPVNSEFERIAWERPEKLPEYEFLEGDREFIRLLADQLS